MQGARYGGHMVVIPFKWNVHKKPIYREAKLVSAQTWEDVDKQVWGDFVVRKML